MYKAISSMVLLFAVNATVLGQGGELGAGGREPARFAERNFPGPSLLFLSVRDVSSLAAEAAKTLPGRILTHPETKRAAAGLWAKIQEEIAKETREFVEVTGRTPLELIQLFTGEVSFTLRGLSPLPEFAFAIEVGDHREAILAVLANLERAFNEAGGRLGTRDFGPLEAKFWPSPMGVVFQLLVDEHLVITNSIDMIEAMTKLRDGAANGVGEPLGQSSLVNPLAGMLTDRKAGNGGDRSDILVAVDVARLRRRALEFVASQPNIDEVLKILRVTGLERLTTARVVFGVRDGAADLALDVGVEPGGDDLLTALSGLVQPVDDVTEGLSLLPQRASEVAVMRLDLGGTLARLDRLARREFPEFSGELDSVFQEIEEQTGVSVTKDLYSLPSLPWFGFTAEPHAGGLINDSITLTRSEAFQPYWALAQRVGALLQAGTRTIELGPGEMGAAEPGQRKVEYLSPDLGSSGLLEGFMGGLDVSSAMEMGLFPVILGGGGRRGCQGRVTWGVGGGLCRAAGARALSRARPTGAAPRRWRLRGLRSGAPQGGSRRDGFARRPWASLGLQHLRLIGESHRASRQHRGPGRCAPASRGDVLGVRAARVRPLLAAT